jgi:TolC family type I secretion outer membrane protein
MGCSVAETRSVPVPEAAKPLAPVESSNLPTSADAVADPAASPAEERELTLEEAITLARQGNPDLQSAVARVGLANAILDSARANFYPQLGISEIYGASNQPVLSFTYLLNQSRFSLNRDLNHPPVTQDYLTQAQIQQRLYEGGRRMAELGASAAELSASNASLAAVQNELVFRVAEAYYRLLQARDLVEVRREAVRQVQQQLELVESRFRAETAVKSDVLSVQVRLAEVREALITAGNQLQLSWAVLEAVTGTRLGGRQLPREVPAAPWAARAEQLEQAVAIALRTRPEVAELTSRSDGAQQRIRAAQAGHYPTVDVQGGYEVFTPDFYHGGNDFTLGVVASLTLFDGGRTASQVRQAEARLAELQARQRQLMLQIELGVRKAYLQLADARERLEVATQAITQAEESLREIESRYRGQKAIITELIDAQVALSNARVRRTNAQAEVEIARASLEQGIGRLGSLLAP